MNIGIIGLGKMGASLVDRLVRAGFTVYGFDIDEQARKEGEACGAVLVDSSQVVAKQCAVIWLMVPAGKLIDQVLEELLPHMNAQTIIIDGGNSKFTDSMERYAKLKKEQIYFLDCGTSGGLRGQYTGFCLMIGGDKPVFERVEPIFKAVAAPQGYVYTGSAGSGHYVKMVHNGIEYALMQAYAEGLQMLKEGYYKDLNLADICSVWQHGAVIRSWLLTLLYEIMLEDQTLTSVSGSVAESGMGRWTVEQAQKYSIPTQLIEDALAIRLWSQESGGNYATKVVSLLRNKFGGHAVKSIKE